VVVCSAEEREEATRRIRAVGNGLVAPSIAGGVIIGPILRYMGPNVRPEFIHLLVGSQLGP
jgi:hypothetical protein